ncbi:MAG: CAP domain-containing protein [Steroidobacteraceae bacterium]
MRRLLVLVFSLATLPLTAKADVVAAINEARFNGCHANPGTTPKLRENPRLNEAARRLSRGEDLQDASRRAGYRSVNSASLHMPNVPDDGDVARLVARQFCTQITARDLQEIGTYRRGPEVWLLIAAPFTPPAPAERQAISRRVLELTNQARSHARRCGAEAFPAAPPLALGPPALERAAADHSQEMANHDYMDHTGRDSSSPADRVTRAGYKWSSIGENLASGVMTAEAVVNGWVGSPHHCENLMSPRFTEMSVAYAVNLKSSGGIYWTQVFGTPMR